MFNKILTTIKLARHGAKLFDEAQAKLEAIKTSDTVIVDGQPDVENLRTVIGGMKDTAIIFFNQGKDALKIIKGLIRAARDA